MTGEYYITLERPTKKVFILSFFFSSCLKLKMLWKGKEEQLVTDLKSKEKTIEMIRAMENEAELKQTTQIE